MAAIGGHPLFENLVHPFDGEAIPPFPDFGVAVAKAQDAAVAVVDRDRTPPLPFAGPGHLGGTDDKVMVGVPVARFPRFHEHIAS